tara:strand:+ start:181 stop:480 length:300 start_codon:yes stop_codon:yes gene_type:complete
MVLVIVLVMAVYFGVGGIVGYILGRAVGRLPLVIFCLLLGAAILGMLVLPAIGVDTTAILGDDTRGNRIVAYSALSPGLAGAVLLGALGLRQRRRAGKG